MRKSKLQNKQKFVRMTAFFDFFFFVSINNSSWHQRLMDGLPNDCAHFSLFWIKTTFWNCIVLVAWSEHFKEPPVPIIDYDGFGLFLLKFQHKHCEQQSSASLTEIDFDQHKLINDIYIYQMSIAIAPIFEWMCQCKTLSMIFFLNFRKKKKPKHFGL